MPPQQPPSDSAAWAVQVIPGARGGFGYEIRQQGKALIRQPFVPAYPGSQGFPDSLSAHSAGQLVLRKLRAGLFPPTLSRREVDSLLKAHSPR